MDILLAILTTTLIIIDIFSLRKLEKKNKELTKENMRLKKLFDKGV